MLSHAPQLMDTYSDLEDPLTDGGSFVLLMVVDACFLLAFLYNDSDLLADSDPLKHVYVQGVGGVAFMVQNIDLYLLENQVPFDAVRIIADLGADKVGVLDLRIWGEAAFHMLHANLQSLRIRNNFLSLPPLDREVNPPRIANLLQAGFSFEKSENNIISFQNGVLKIPELVIGIHTEIGFYNIIAFELMNCDDPEFCSYLEFMHCFVDRVDDAEYLRKKRIVWGSTASDDDVANCLTTLQEEHFLHVKEFTKMNSGDLPKGPMRCYKEIAASFRETKNPAITNSATARLCDGKNI